MQTRMSKVGNVLVFSGAFVGVATVAAIATGYKIELSPEMIQLVTYKALGAAAVGLMVVGTWIGRRGREKDSVEPISDPRLLEGDLAPPGSSPATRDPLPDRVKDTE